MPTAEQYREEYDLVFISGLIHLNPDYAQQVFHNAQQQLDNHYGNTSLATAVQHPDPDVQQLAAALLSKSYIEHYNQQAEGHEMFMPEPGLMYTEKLLRMLRITQLAPDTFEEGQLAAISALIDNVQNGANHDDS